MAGSLKFNNPHTLQPIEGTEGWERMYPYQYTFVTDDPKRKLYEERMFWFYDALHYPEPLYPFDTIWDEAWYLGLSQYNTRIFSVPPVYGIDHRIINGYPYVSPVPVADPKEVETRIGNFVERARFYYENWPALEAKWVEKMKAIIAELETIRFERLPQLEDLRVVKEGVGESSGYHLLRAYDQLIDLGIRCWQYHFEFLNLGYAAYVTFMDFCHKLFPEMELQRITQMVAGIDVIMYRPDDELKKLARKALELNVDGMLASSKSFKVVEQELAGSAAGRQWLAEFEGARYPWFYISTGTGWYHSDRCWNDKLDVPLASIRAYVEKLRAGGSIERPLEKIRAERDRITAEYRSLIPNKEDQLEFDGLLNTCRMVFPYVENHLFYVEHWFHSLFWNKVREVGAILKEHGLIGDVEDIWYLKRGEIKDALWDVVTAWATGIEPRGCSVWPREIEWRKGVLEKFRQWNPPPAVGLAPEVIQDPFTIVLWGITSDSLKAWSDVQAKVPDSIESLRGFAASPGTAEGNARICRSVEEIDKLQEGEILVAPTTSPSWAPAFVRIKACVTDVGGVMSHAAIVCREYGMPAVVGTGHATRLIRNGVRIRVNGSTGEVTIVR